MATASKEKGVSWNDGGDGSFARETKDCKFLTSGLRYNPASNRRRKDSGESANIGAHLQQQPFSSSSGIVMGLDNVVQIVDSRPGTQALALNVQLMLQVYSSPQSNEKKTPYSDTDDARAWRIQSFADGVNCILRSTLLFRGQIRQLVASC